MIVCWGFIYLLDLPAFSWLFLILWHRTVAWSDLFTQCVNKPWVSVSLKGPCALSARHHCTLACGPPSQGSSVSLWSALVLTVRNLQHRDVTASSLVISPQVPTYVRVAQAGWCLWGKLYGRTPTSSCVSLWSLREPLHCLPLLVPPCAACFQRCSTQIQMLVLWQTSWRPECAVLSKRTPTEGNPSYQTILVVTTTSTTGGLWLLTPECRVSSK